MVERPEEVSALVQARNAGGEGYDDCDADQVIYTIRFREDGRWTEPVTVPAACGSTQGTARPYKATDEARDLLSAASDDARQVAVAAVRTLDMAARPQSRYERP